MSSLTREHIEIVIARAVRCGGAKILKHSVEPFADNQNGILGSHYLLKVEISKEDEDANGGVVVTFFVKTRPESNFLQELIMDECACEDELNFYSNVLPQMLQLYNGEKWCAKCYLATRDFFVFEDLRVQSYAIPNDFPLDVEPLRSAIVALARFHACSILVEAQLGGGKRLKDAYPEAFQEKIYSDTTKLGKTTVVGYATIRLIAEKFGLDASLVPKIHDLIYKLVRYDADGLNVICHGDLWKNNLMFNNNASPPKCLLIDFQLLRYASPAVDLSFLIYVNTTPEFKRSSELKMFDHYYTAFKDTLHRNNSEIEIPTYEFMLKDYNEHKIVGMSYASLYLPGLYMHPEDVSRLFNNPESLRTWFFVNRIDVISATMEKDPVYTRKVRDIYEEFFSEAERVLK